MYLRGCSDYSDNPLISSVIRSSNRQSSVILISHLCSFHYEFQAEPDLKYQLSHLEEATLLPGNTLDPNFGCFTCVTLHKELPSPGLQDWHSTTGNPTGWEADEATAFYWYP